MQIKTMKLKDIKPYENNPRINDNAVQAVIESIKQCGYIAPIIIDENNVILAGHTRYKALQKLGNKEAEVIIRDGLTEEQKKKYRIIDNKTSEFAEWDFSKLEKELEGLDFGDFDFDFEMPRWNTQGSRDTETQMQQVEPTYTPNGVMEGVPTGEDPYLPENYNDDDIQQYVDNQENYVVKKRVIITYLPEQEKSLMGILGIQGDTIKVVYDFDELAK